MMAIIIMRYGQSKKGDKSGWEKCAHGEFEESNRSQIMEYH